MQYRVLLPRQEIDRAYLECTVLTYTYFSITVLHLESPILSEATSLDGYEACLQQHQKTVGKHIKGVVALANLPADTAIPFKVNIIEKVLLTLDKADIEEKNASDEVPE